MTHCLTFDVLGHLDGTLLPANANDAAWHKRDGLVKLWIYGTLAPPLFRSSFHHGGTARDVWLRIENQFRNNKEERAIQLDHELLTQEIGDRTIQEYCQKIKSLADLLTNVDASVARNMLEMEESRLKKTHRLTATHANHSSSSTVLIVAEAPPMPRPSHQPGPYRPPVSLPHQYQNQQQAHLMEIQPAGHTTETLPNPNGVEWYMDSGATAHLSASAGSSNSDNSTPM
ncbi:hypothetical protein AALP_AA8G268500 [Arabis alpina]|uniref:Uncharacterized protein n=1 Tax=Arabis alpina TaxID=50452 RepID=A0A087G9N8_ARAAL|nr:hypothetical protein AALP_AA8G268500 [Arabis alpina]